jgi:hypothetical protein
VSGAKTVLANPPATVKTVSAPTRRGPYQRVTAANAGGYSTALIAAPASTQAATNQPIVGAHATPITATTATAEPRLINHRGPCRSNHRPTATPPTADTTRPAENPATTAGADQPVSAPILPASTGNA